MRLRLRVTPPGGFPAPAPARFDGCARGCRDAATPDRAQTPASAMLSLHARGSSSFGLIVTVVQAMALPHPARISIESAPLHRLPIAALGDRDARKQMDARGRVVMSLPEHGWSVEGQRDDAGGTLTPGALDVLSAVLFLFHARGGPENGVVPFSRYGLIRLLGWTGGAAPRSRHYEQLERYIWHLTHTRLQLSGVGIPDPLRDGKLVNGKLDFPLLAASLLVNDPPGRKTPTEPPREGASWVELSTPLIRLVAPSAERVAFSLGVLWTLPPGASRQWWRMLAALRGDALDHEMPLDELLVRVGSAETHAVPARVRRVFGAVHESALASGLLSKAPVFERRGGAGGRRWWVTYEGVATPAPVDADNVIEHAVGYGLSESVARRLLEEHPRSFREGVAALISGVVTGLRNPAGWLRKAAEEEWTVPTATPESLRVGAAARTVMARGIAVPVLVGESPVGASADYPPLPIGDIPDAVVTSSALNVSARPASAVVTPIWELLGAGQSARREDLLAEAARRLDLVEVVVQAWDAEAEALPLGGAMGSEPTAESGGRPA